MESGSPDLLPDTLAGQSNFDALVQATGCETSPNRLDCLRHAPFDVVKAAVDQTPLFISFTVSISDWHGRALLMCFTFQSLRFIWGPSVDGRLFKDSPLTSILDGQVANVPFATGVRSFHHFVTMCHGSRTYNRTATMRARHSRWLS